MWRQLRAAGWTDKKPTGLSLQWGYVTPDRAHVFYGEAALVEHAFKSGLLDQGEILTPTSAAEDTKTSATAKPRTTSAAVKRTATSAAAKPRTTSAAAKTTTMGAAAIGRARVLSLLRSSLTPTP
ncbi:uncharacterized protein IUM83_15623 [Phytophthora cinnamomi]|uniref:uncharacterized protein n=1 Tax=Phytophthora cinnamomi TaxID=4785 RepID=UPI003559AD39|nr:hypothetical protein IUM83_15623 [Phytophthora cinnamomi]